MDVIDFDDSLLIEFAGERYFGRGEKYFHEGRVRSLVEHEGTVAAKVAGTHEYRVRLWGEDGELLHSCDCPLGMDGEFCKHCVAVGLAWLEGDAPDDPSTSATTMDDIKAYLESREKDVLVGLVVEQAMEDERLRERLLLRAARVGGPNVGAFQKAVDAAVAMDDFPDYDSPREYTRRMESIVASISELLDEGYADEGVELAEYALAAVEGAMRYDVDGSILGVLYDLEGVHHEACRRAEPDVEALARRIFEWEVGGEYDTFFDAANNYADVLGEEGMAEYRRLAGKEWAEVPALGPDPANAPPYYGRRWRLTHIMKTLAARSGDVEALVAVEAKDLSNARSYMRVSAVYKEAGDYDKALEWAEEGMWIFPDDARSGLREFVVEEYHRRGRHDEAMNLVWKSFTEHPGLELYRELKSHAERAGAEWGMWREKALSRIREGVEKRKEESKSAYFMFSPDNSPLVEAYIFEGEVEEAWREAKEGGCSEPLWLELASLREEEYPEEALEIYEERIEPLVEQTNNAAYEEAYELLMKTRSIMRRTGREAEFDEYLELLRAEYKRKRNFIKLLDGME